MVINKNKDYCYRICHIDNISHLLNNGLCTKYHPSASEDYISIGNSQIIDVREDTQVRINGYGNISDYVPFYFTPKSMMLLNIITGYRKPVVKMIPKDKIIIVRCVISELAKLDKFFFTDGQANERSITKHYSDLKYLDCIDWEIIQNCDFKRTVDDTDKTRRYQAEFLVYNQVPIKCIESIIVFNDKAAKFVKTEMAKTDLLFPIHTNKEYFFA